MIASSKSFSKIQRRIWLSPEAVPPVKSGEPFSIIAARPTFSSSFAMADCKNSICESPPPGKPAPQRLFSLAYSLFTASSWPAFASLPLQGVPKGGFISTKRILVSAEGSSLKESACTKLVASWPFISISAMPTAQETPINSTPNSLTSAVGL